MLRNNAALNPFWEACRKSVLYGKVRLGPSFCSEQAYCGCDLPVRGGSATQRWLKESGGQAPDGKVANKDERTYIDVPKEETAQAVLGRVGYL